MTTRYKFLRLDDNQIKSEHGNHAWIVGEWYSSPDAPQLCSSGFHCSARMSQAFSYVQGELVALVEVNGAGDESDDKEAWADMRLSDVRHWRKEDSVALAVFAAELVLENFESAFPNDSRPRAAIEAAKAWLADPTPENEAASAARAAWSAASAASAASAWSGSAASAARAAAMAAEASAAAWSGAAAMGAWSAAMAAPEDRATVVSRISDWMEARFESLPAYSAETVDGVL